jgi:hypothetical protein
MGSSMKNPIELLIELHNMYSKGELAAEFDNRRNKMVNSDKLKSIMSDVENLIPSKLEPKQAADAMRRMEEEERDKAIKEAEDKVIDMRKQFQSKMAENGGALGLTKRLVKALEQDDLATVGLVTHYMKELVDHSE